MYPNHSASHECVLFNRNDFRSAGQRRLPHRLFGSITDGKSTANDPGRAWYISCNMLVDPQFMDKKEKGMTRPRFRYIVQASFLALFLFQCTSTAERTSAPSPDPLELWTYISRTNPYTQWRYWPGYEDKSPGLSPHGALLELYANDTAMRAAGGDMGTMPYGSILVKENYARDGETLLSITPMYKVRGYNPGAGDWFWAEYGPDGKVRAAGRVQSCIQCHSASKRDFLYTQPRQVR